MRDFLCRWLRCTKSASEQLSSGEQREETLPLDSLDEGVRDYVAILRAGGVETYESCEGGPGHSYPEPAVRFHGPPAAGFHAYAVAVTHQLPVSWLRRIWRVSDGELTGPHWEMVFTRKGPVR